jgi:hypothetical protein
MKTLTLITKKELRGDYRVRALPKNFPVIFMYVEQAVFNTAKHFSEDYNGGFWDFYQLSNGGFLMTPENPMTITNTYNFTEETVSAEAAGIVFCILTYSRLGDSIIEKQPELAEILYRHINLLKDYAEQHEEAVKIYRLID